MASVDEFSDRAEKKSLDPVAVSGFRVFQKVPSLKGLIVSAALFLTASMAFAATAAAPGSAGQPVMAIFPPSSSAADVMLALHEADGELLTLGRFDNLVISRADSDGYPDRLYAAGALLVVDPAVAYQFGL